MSKKTAIKETLSEENIDAPVRRSTRNAVNPTSANSAAPKSIGTRRGSGSSIVEKKKPHNGDSSPVELAGRRKTRRTSTEEDTKSTPIKTRRSSISKIIEEDKKIASSPKTPSRKVGSRAASTSPSNTTEVPARRTRRSISASQENEVVEQIPLRRSTRRRSSVDTQEDVSNEEVLIKSKPTPRRRRSNSVDENEETTKTDVKSKTKRLYSEDNQLEPIEEHETEVTEKSERKSDETVVEMERDHNLSVIEESEDTVQKDSKKIIKDIDNMLTNMISSSKPKTVTEKITTRSIFSPMTPKPILSEQNTDIDCEIISSDSDTENELPKSHQSENMKSDSLKNTSLLKKPSNEESSRETRKTPLSSAKSNKIGSSKENFITNGSDDSFTLNSSKILDRIQSSNNETDEDVFTSPGSNKENNFSSVPPKKNENRVVLKEKKSSELSDLDVEDDVFASKTSLINDDKPMEVDCEDKNVEDRSKMDIPDCSDKESKMLSFDKTEQNDMKEVEEDSEISVQKVTSSGDNNGITETKDISGNVSSKDETSKHSSGRSPEKVVINKNEVKSNMPVEDSGNDASCSSAKSNLEVENSFTSLNSNDDNKLDLSFNIFKSPKVYSKQRNSLTSSPGKCADKFNNKKESKDSSVSSDFSIQMIDSDEEDEGNKRESVGEQNSNTSKQPQVLIEGNSISESETTISANTNTSMRESETEEGIEEVNNDAAAKEHAELSLEEVATGSPKKKSKSHQPILEVNSSPSDEKSKDENAIEDSTPLLNSLKSESKLNEFEKSNPIRKSPRKSFNNKSQDDGDKDTLDVKGVECEKNSLKIISSPSNNQGQKQCTEQSNIMESITESELNSSVKVNVIQEIKLSKNIVTELVNSEDSSLSDTYCKKKSKASHSLNSSLVEINPYVEVEQVEDELIDSEQKPHFLNDSSVAGEAETEKRHGKSKLNDSLTKQRNKNQIKKKQEIDEINAREEIENSEDGNLKEEVVEVIEDNTKMNVEVENQKKQFKPESKQDDGEKIEPISDVKSKKDKSTPRIGDRNSKVSDEITSARSCDVSLSESDVETDSTRHKSNRPSKIENESIEVAISPFKSKMEKMKECSVNFVNPSPTATRIRLDEKTSKKLDEYLNERFSALHNEEQESQSDENKSEDENESRDDHNSSQFLDDMAEEGEEDTPSEGSNDIVDEGESINSKDSEIDSDDTYDSNDSFLVKDDGDDLDLLPGDEYDLGDTPELTKKASKKRRRIVKNLNTSSEGESSPLSSRVSFSDKVEVIPDKKSPRKQISPIKITDKANKNKNNFHTDLQDAQHEESPKEEPHMEIPSIFVDLINDSSEEERPASKQNETPAFDETVRSLIEDEKSSTPNASFNETSNTSRQNNSLRSSSIIIHENVNINEIKEGLLTEKLQQVVSVFCAGIRSSDGNISMNVSLDYVENPSKECDNIKVNDVEQTIKSPVGAKAEAKSRHSSNKSEDNNDSVNQESSRKRKLSNISPKNIQKQPSLNNVFIEEIPVEDLSVLNASFNDEISMLDESSRMMDSGSAKKKRRSSSRKEKQLCNKNIVTSDISCENDKETQNMEEKFEESSLKTEELQVSTSKKRRRSSNKIEKPLNANLEKSLGKEDFSEKKVEDNSDHEQTKHMSSKSPCIGEKQESKNSNYEQRLYIIKDITEEESEPVKKKKKHNKRKCIEKTSKEVLPEIVTSERKKLVEMQCNELSANDLRHKLPSFKETSEESNAALKKKKLKRLQSNLKRDLKSTLLLGLVTDVKNRPRRMLKPSIEMDAKDWLIEEAASKPSSANLSKSSFNFNKIDAKDFKNQILYDPRIKREQTSAFLRKKGHY